MSGSATWAAEDVRHLDRAADVARSAPPGEPLADVLYHHWYAALAEPAQDLPSWSAPLESVLRTAHAGGRTWSGPCPVVANGVAGVAVVEQGGSRRAAARGDYVTYGQGAGLAPTTSSQLLVVRRRGCYAYDGWWRTWSDDWHPAQAPPGLSRIYFSPFLPGLGRLVATLTTELAGVDHAWSLKVGADPLTLSRADGAVLYVPDEAVEALAARLARSCADLVRTATPPLTRRVAPGIAWAQDPGTGDSYGEVLTGLVADAWRRRGSAESLAEAARRTFERAGRHAGAPHLRSPSTEENR